MANGETEEIKKLYMIVELVIFALVNSVVLIVLICLLIKMYKTHKGDVSFLDDKWIIEYEWYEGQYDCRKLDTNRKS